MTSSIAKVVIASTLATVIIFGGSTIANARKTTDDAQIQDHHEELSEETFEPETLETEVTLTCADLNREMTLQGNVYASQAGTGNKIITPVDDDYEIQIIDGKLMIYDSAYQIVAMSSDFTVTYN
jgi:hypothetical protein